MGSPFYCEMYNWPSTSKRSISNWIRLSLELLSSDLGFGWYFQSRDIKNNVQFYAIHGVATPYFDCLVKSMACYEGCKKNSLGIDDNFQGKKEQGLRIS